MSYILDERFMLRSWDKLPNAVVDRKDARTLFVGRESEMPS